MIGRGSSEIEPLRRRPLGGSACAGANLLPQSGQVSKPTAAALPTSKVMPSRSTVTSVRMVRLVPRPDVPERKKLARPDSHW